MRATLAINSAALPDRYRLAPDYFVKLAPFDKIHAEVAATLALAHFMNGNDKWMVEAGGGFRFAAKALQMRFSGPRAQANYFERDGTIETLLMRAINYTLTAPADFLQQFVVAKVSQHFSRSRAATDAWQPRVITYVFIFVAEQTKAGFQTGKPGKIPAARRQESLRRTFRKRY